MKSQTTLFAFSRKIIFLAFLLCGYLQVISATVPVHDPSIVIVYKDANGNSFPTNDAGATRKKYYYIFGTQLGAAYSTDMLNWTAFTPSFAVNGSITTNYYQAFKVAADWSKHTTSNTVKENLWAPDVIYNKVLKKWCLYFSVNGDDWLSSIVMHTSDKIEGPYTYAGSVVYSGMDKTSSGTGNADYQKVTGSSTVASRYLDNNGNWTGTYGSSCIDPAVLYDENGNLQLVYGSWSGGIFVLKLDANTGLRDYSKTYSTTSSGTRLRSDAYMGTHIAGGYYVSGEGPYIEYIKDANGVGYYYLFVSMGFYSPEGGYTMRVFRSASIDGVYKDVTGDDAVFSNYIFNYGNNLQYGFPIMQNYKWSWWAEGAAEIAQGHNSVLQDEDGKAYLIYHRKLDNGTPIHNVEVHQLFFNEKGWILAAPFEYKKGYDLSTTSYTTEDIAGLYGIITHNAVDYANLTSNREQQLYINADGSITGAYTGSWTYNFANGKQYITLLTNAGNFEGVLCEQLMNNLSSKTIAFTSMNSANERALWGYRYTNTNTANTTVYNNQSLLIGKTDYSLQWNAYFEFQKETASGDFEMEYIFDNNTLGVENWHNWALAFVNGSETWHLRADAWSISTFTGSKVGYNYTWNWDTEFKSVFKNKEVRLKVSKIGTSINVFAYVGNVIVYTASASNVPSGNYTIYLGGESTYLNVKKVSNGSLGTRQLVGTVNDDGTYPAIFNTNLGQTTSVTGDFELHYIFNNYHNSISNDNWDNFILRAISSGNPMLLRADAFALDTKGTLAYTYDWSWANFLNVISDAKIDLTITRKSSVITYTFLIMAKDGLTYHYQVVNTGAPTSDMSFGFTCEESMVDIYKVEKTSTVGGSIITSMINQTEQELDIYTNGQILYIKAEKEGVLDMYDIAGRKIKQLQYNPGTSTYSDLDQGIYILNKNKVVIMK